jgi:hypothetical protein
MKFIDNIGFAPWLNKFIHILFYLLVLASLLLPFYLDYLSSQTPDYNNKQKEVYLGHDFSGKVKDIFIDNHNHSAKTIKFYDGSKFVTNPFVMTYINIGDSITKFEKDSIVIIYKTNNDTIFYDIVNSNIIQNK